MDGAFFLKSPVAKNLPASIKGVALDPTAYGFACEGSDKLCSTAYSQLWQHFGGSSGGVIAKLKAKYGIDGRVAFVSFSAGHGFLNPLLKHENPDAVILLDSTFGGGKDGYVRGAKAAAAGGPLFVSVTSDKGTTDALNNGDYAWREFVLKPAGLSLAPRGAVPPMPTPAGGVSGAGNLWYYRYTHAQVPHTSMGLAFDAISAHLIPYWGAKKYENVFWWALGAGLAGIGAWWLYSNRSRFFSNGLEVYLARPGQVPGIGYETGRARTNGVSRFVSPHGSYRYVMYAEGVPLAAMQVVSQDGVYARVANVYVRPEVRRRGLASALFKKAQRDFLRLEHASESARSPEAKAWISGMSKKSDRIAT